MKDAGCGSKTIAETCRLYDTGQVQAVIKLLRRHRIGLMDQLHESQERIDCLDYLIYQLEKSN